jgi:hypothetical protein
MDDTWLIVWGGDVDDGVLADGVLAAAPSHEEAHHLRFKEVGGPRTAMLLVHYTEEERDQVLSRLEAEWEYGFVNATRPMT